MTAVVFWVVPFFLGMVDVLLWGGADGGGNGDSGTS